MTATGHALIGVVIAAKISNPLLAIPLAFSSHIIADLLPHWDAGTHGRKKTGRQLTIEAAADVLIGFIASYIAIVYIFPHTPLSYAFIMILAAQAIDWLTAPYYMFGLKVQPFIFFHSISSMTNTKLDKPWGIVSQIVFVSSLILLALTL